MNPGSQPRADISPARNRRKIIKLCQQVVARKSLQESQSKGAATNAATGKAQSRGGFVMTPLINGSQSDFAHLLKMFREEVLQPKTVEPLSLVEGNLTAVFLAVQFKELLCRLAELDLPTLLPVVDVFGQNPV